MKIWAQGRVAAACIGLYLALYAGYIATHSISASDHAAYAKGFAFETSLMLVWWVFWSAASWLHARRDDLITHLSLTALGGTVCAIALFAALPWGFYLLDLPWNWGYYSLARSLGLMAFAVLAWRAVTGHLPRFKPWVFIAAALLGLQILHLWADRASSDAQTQLPFEANIVVPLGSLGEPPTITEGLARLWAQGWE